MIQAWDDTHNLVRNVTGVVEEKPGRIELRIERFPKRIGSLALFDNAKAASQDIVRRGTRHGFREHFRRFLMRRFTGWKIAELSTEPSLEASLSPAYPRALLKNWS